MTICLSSLTAYSQVKALIGSDTIIYFTVKQAKFLLKTQYELRECKELNAVDTAIITQKDSIISNQSFQINALKEIDSNSREAIRILEKQVKRERRLRRLTSVVGGVLVVVSVLL